MNVSSRELSKEQSQAAERQKFIATIRKGISASFTYLLMTLLAFFFLFPIVFMLVASFKEERYVLQDLGTVNAFVPNPETITLSNFIGEEGSREDVGMINRPQEGAFWGFMYTSVIITALTVGVGLFLNSMAAFSLARLRFLGRSALVFIVVSLVIIPLEAIAIPLMIQVNEMSVQMNVFIMALLLMLTFMLWLILWNVSGMIANYTGIIKRLPEWGITLFRGAFTLALAFPIELLDYYMFQQMTDEQKWADMLPGGLADLSFMQNELTMFIISLALIGLLFLTWAFLWNWAPLRQTIIQRLNINQRNVGALMLLRALAVFLIALPLEIALFIFFGEFLAGAESWFNSYHVLIVPFLADPFSIFLFYQFFIGIPKDFDEAAVVDGASHFRIYWNIAVPLSRPVFATVAILQGLRFWSFYMWPLLVVQEQDFMPLMIGMQFLRAGTEQTWGQQMAYAALVTIPILILFLVFQSWFVRSVSSSGVKG